MSQELKAQAEQRGEVLVSVADPVAGPNYEAGLWSRRNWDAAIADQRGHAAPLVPVVPSARWSKPAARQWMETVCTKSASAADRLLAVAAHVAGQRYALGESHESTLSHPDGEGAEVTPAPVAPDGVAKMRELLRRYRTETPLCHQPHMIALEVDELLAAAPEVKP